MDTSPLASRVALHVPVHFDSHMGTHPATDPASVAALRIGEYRQQIPPGAELVGRHDYALTATELLAISATLAQGLIYDYLSPGHLSFPPYWLSLRMPRLVLLQYLDEEVYSLVSRLFAIVPHIHNVPLKKQYRLV
jgi:hypothetical protein